MLLRERFINNEDFDTFVQEVKKIITPYIHTEVDNYIKYEILFIINNFINRNITAGIIICPIEAYLRQTFDSSNLTIDFHLKDKKEVKTNVYICE